MELKNLLETVIGHYYDNGVRAGIVDVIAFKNLTLGMELPNEFDPILFGAQALEDLLVMLDFNCFGSDKNKFFEIIAAADKACMDLCDKYGFLCCNEPYNKLPRIPARLICSTVLVNPFEDILEANQ